MSGDAPPTAPPERWRALEAAGASGTVLDELLRYGAPLLTRARADEFAGLELPDEPQLLAWTRYAKEAEASGAVAALALVFPQLRYPVRKGMSEAEGYRAATRRGAFSEDDPEATGLPVRRPDLITVGIHPTLAGRIPILVAGDREDFESLVRAFSARNEPVDVPASMGACLVRGLNNWDRVRTYRTAWEAKDPFGDWDEEFRALVPKKELYEDRFILLSTGPYSGVPAEGAGFPSAEWLALSVSIRREHEATHYFTLRAAGTVRNNLVDELIADYVGLVRTFGVYRDELALSFFGLEAFPTYREGARFQNYRGKPPLSDAAFEVAKRLVFGAVRNLARLDAACPPASREGAGLAKLVLSLTSRGLEELASSDLLSLLPAAPSPPVDVGDTGPLPRFAVVPGGRLALEVPADRPGIDEAIESFDAFAKGLALAGEAVFSLHLVLDEVLSNKMKYGWDEPGNHRVDVDIRVKDGAMEMVFTDDAKEFDPVATRDPDVESPLEEKPIGGLGIYLVKKLTDEQQYERRGSLNRLRVVKNL